MSCDLSAISLLVLEGSRVGALILCRRFFDSTDLLRSGHLLKQKLSEGALGVRFFTAFPCSLVAVAATWPTIRMEAE